MCHWYIHVKSGSFSRCVWYNICTGKKLCDKQSVVEFKPGEDTIRKWLIFWRISPFKKRAGIQLKYRQAANEMMYQVIFMALTCFLWLSSLFVGLNGQLNHFSIFHDYLFICFNRVLCVYGAWSISYRSERCRNMLQAWQDRL